MSDKPAGFTVTVRHAGGGGSDGVTIPALRPVTTTLLLSESVDDVRSILQARILELESLLGDVHDALLPYEDVRDGDDGIPQPNWAMTLIMRINEALR